MSYTTSTNYGGMRTSLIFFNIANDCVKGKTAD